MTLKGVAGLFEGVAIDFRFQSGIMSALKVRTVAVYL